MARKLKECGVFGVSSNEYLDYAEKNRQECVDRGEEVVNEMIERAREHWNPQDNQKAEQNGTVVTAWDVSHHEIV